MWKDFFYFSKGERKAIVFLLGMIVTIIGVWLVSPYLIEESSKETGQESFEEIERFLAGIQTIEHKRNASFKKKEVVKRKVILAPFEPNLTDSIEFLQLGLPPFIAHNIIKYRQAGGKFATAEAFSRIYGMTEEQFHILEPYIYISESFQKKSDTLRYAEVEKRDTLAFYKYPEGTLIDLNRADTTELKKIPGIGIGIARAIVAYRNQLGGFYDVGQLQELKWITSDMQHWFKVENGPIHRINANKAGLDRLRAHPYINYYQARVIIELRRKKDKLKSLSQLSLYEEFTEKDLKRLSHYLTFD